MYGEPVSRQPRVRPAQRITATERGRGSGGLPASGEIGSGSTSQSGKDVPLKSGSGSPRSGQFNF